MAIAFRAASCSQNATYDLNSELGLCQVFTVVESPVIIQTCFPTNTVLSIDGCTTIEIAGPTCIDTTVISSSTLTSSEDASVPTNTFPPLVT